jgi:acetoin utilization protein AcuB
MAMTALNVRSWMSSVILTVGPKDNLQRARTLIREKHVPEICVIDDGKIVGLLSERDIWEHCPTSILILEEKQAVSLLEHIRVGGVMTLHPPMVTPDTSLREAAHLLAQSGRQGLPVVENGKVVGMLTEERMLQAMAAVLNEVEQNTTVRPAP